MAIARIVTIPGNPGQVKKNAAHIAYAGSQVRCKSCGKPRGQPHIREGEYPPGVARSLTDQAFARGWSPAEGMVMAGMIAYWPTKWIPGGTGRAPGRPRGDVDAPVSGVLDVVAKVLYRDDAQVALMVAANAKVPKGQERIEVSVCDLSPQLLKDLKRELGLDFPGATLSVGEQVGLSV